MTAPDDDFPAGWLTQLRRGFLSGIVLFLLAIGLCAVPAYLTWFVPGADTTPAISALKAAALLALSGAHGGIVLNGTATSLTPLLVTLVLGWLVVGQARRTESWYIFSGSVLGYGTASAVIAGWARIGSTHAPVGRSFLAAVLFTAVIGGSARVTELSWAQLSSRYRRIIRAAAAVTVTYLAAAALLSAVVLAAHLHDAAALQRQVAPGLAGLPVALLGIAATPNAVIAVLGYLIGPGFAVGSHTSVSVVSVSHGPLPLFPLLAGLPQGHPATVFGVVAVTALALLAGWLLVRVSASGLPWSGRLLDCGSAAVLAAGALMLLTALGAGGLGSGALHSIGALWWAVGGMSLLVLLFGSAIWLAVEVIRASRAAVVSEAEPVARTTSLYAVAREPEPDAEPDATTEADDAPAERRSPRRNAG